MQEGEIGQPPRAAEFPHWLDTKATAAYLSVTTRQLEAWRSQGNGPPCWVRVTPRCIRYSRLLLDDWLRKRLQSSTAEVRP